MLAHYQTRPASAARQNPRWTGATPPRVPTLIHPAPANAESFGDVLSLARKVSRLRQGRPLILRYAPHTHLGATFPAFQIFAVDPDGDEVWLGAAAVQTRDQDILRAALERVDPQ